MLISMEIIAFNNQIPKISIEDFSSQRRFFFITFQKLFLAYLRKRFYSALTFNVDLQKIGYFGKF